MLNGVWTQKILSVATPEVQMQVENFLDSKISHSIGENGPLIKHSQWSTLLQMIVDEVGCDVHSWDVAADMSKAACSTVIQGFTKF